MYRDPHQVSVSIARQVRARASDALYVISVAARLVEMHPTTLRKYERVGFLEPSVRPGARACIRWRTSIACAKSNAWSRNAR